MSELRGPQGPLRVEGKGIVMIPTSINATTIPDAWFQLVYALVKGTVPHAIYQIDRGSYVRQKRLEYDYVTVVISHPGQRPLVPDIPPGIGIPPPVESMEYVEEYFANYLMDEELEPNETYRYSTWLAPGVERVIEQLRGSAGNNQAAISLGGYSACYPSHDDDLIDTDNYIDPGTGERDPPCLRMVHFRLDQQNRLHMALYFRSWDLWGGFPANLAGLQLLKEYVGEQLGAEDGKIIASSMGLHLYDHAIQVAAARIGMAEDEVGDLEDLVRLVGRDVSVAMVLRMDEHK